VILIGKSGVGDAVDSYILNSTYFASHGVKVLGGIFNKIPLDGYYSLEYSSAAITSFFLQYRRCEMPYGYIPMLQDDSNIHIQDNHSVDNNNHIASGAAADADGDNDDNHSDYNNSSGHNDAQNRHNTNQQQMRNNQHCLQFTSFEWKLSDTFIKHVDIQRLMHDIWCYEVMHVYVYMKLS